MLFVSILFAGLLISAHADYFKMNEYGTKDCTGRLHYGHSRASIFCGQIDGLTGSVYVNPSDRSSVVFWSGPRCDGTRLYSVPIGKNKGRCLDVDGRPRSMGFQ